MVYFKRIISTLVFAVGLLALLVGSSYMFLPKDNESEFGVEDPEANAIRGEKQNTIDVLVFGDSESYSNIIPMQIWKDTGIPMFICGTRAQQLNYTQVLIERAFRTQTPKAVILETNSLYRDVPLGTLAVSRLSNYLSIFSHHNRWKTMGFGDKNLTFSNDYKGYKYSDISEPAQVKDYMLYSDEVETISDVNIKYVTEIKEYCEKNGVEFILLSTPSSKNWNYRRHNAVNNLAKELDCRYLDLNLYNDKIKIDWQTDTRDKGDHLNHAGATKASRYLGNYLKDIGDFEDKRNLPEYKHWNELSVRYDLFSEQNKK